MQAMAVATASTLIRSGSILLQSILQELELGGEPFLHFVTNDTLHKIVPIILVRTVECFSVNAAIRGNNIHIVHRTILGTPLRGAARRRRL